MSTRCNIHFSYGTDIVANVYRHSDGYPEGPHGVPASLKRFFEDVEVQTKDRRFGDPSYLAAKFVVWQASQYATPCKPLEFLSVGVAMKDAGDGEYIYTVDCSELGPDGRPSVTWTKA